MNQKGILVNELDRDRYSRTATMNIGKKTITFPNFFPRIKNKEELESLISIITLFPPEYVNAYVVRLSDQPNEIFSNRSKLNQMSLDMKNYANQYLRKFYDETMKIIDPSSEYLYYEGENTGNELLKQLKIMSGKDKKFSNVIKYLENKNLLKKNIPKNEYERKKKSEYKKFWNNLYRSQSEMSKTIGEIHDIEIEYDSDILLPFVPVILNQSMLDITMTINRINNAISPRDSATYLILNTSALSDYELMAKIREYITNDPNRLTVFKIKDPNLEKPGYMIQRENYGELMKTMSDITEENKNKTFILLDGGTQSFPSAIVGFDMVSTSMTGFDKEGFPKVPNSYGGWFYQDKLWSIPYEKAMEMFENNNNIPPCPCPACADIASIGPRNIQLSQWVKLRREHYVYSMNDLMKKIVTSISQRKIELLSQFIDNSEVSKLSELIPRM